MKHTQEIKKTIRSLALVVFGCLLMAGFTTNAAESLDIDFENYSAGTIPGQNGWTQADSDGSPDMEADVVSDSGVASNGSHYLRLINPDAYEYDQAIIVDDDGVYAPPLEDCAGEAGCCATVFEQSFWVRTVDSAHDDGDGWLWALDVRVAASNSSGSGNPSESADMGALAFFADPDTIANEGWGLGVYWMPATEMGNPGTLDLYMTPMLDIPFGSAEHIGIRYEFVAGGSDVVKVFSGSNANASAPGGMGTEVTTDAYGDAISCSTWEADNGSLGVNTTRFYSKTSSENGNSADEGEFAHSGLAIDELTYELVGCGDVPTTTTTETVTTTPTTTTTTPTTTTTTPTTTSTTPTTTTETVTTTTPTTTTPTTTTETVTTTTPTTTTVGEGTTTTATVTTTPTTTSTTATVTTTPTVTTETVTTTTPTTSTTPSTTTTTVVTTSTTTLSGDCACDEGGILSTICLDVESLDLHSVEALSDLIRSKVEEAGAGHCSQSDMDLCTQTIKNNIGL